MILDALQESKLLYNSITDISKYKSLYKVSGKTLPSLSFEKLTHFYSYLKYNSDSVEMTKHYYMRPDYVSYDYYQTINLAWLILWVNDCGSVLQFTMKEIIVPYQHAVSYVLSKSLVSYSQSANKSTTEEINNELMLTNKL